MKTIVGKIYANNCGYCQMLKPEWNKFKLQIKNNKNIQIKEIEQGEYKKMEDFKERYPDLLVNGYPTIFKIYPNKKIEYYTGDRTAIEMKKWATRNIVKYTRINKKSAKPNIFRNKTVKQQKFFGLF